MLKKHLIRITMSLLGVLLIGISIGFSRLADLGTDPFTTFNLGLSDFFNLSFGTYLIIVNVIGLILVALTARYLIGIGTVFNILIVGYVSDWVVNLVTANFDPSNALGMRLLVAGISLVILAIGASLYIVADRGVAPYDALPIIVEDRTGGGISFRAARIISDILCIIIGFFFGATVGIATVVAGFFMGPLIQFFRTQFERMLEKIETV